MDRELAISLFWGDRQLYPHDTFRTMRNVVETVPEAENREAPTWPYVLPTIASQERRLRQRSCIAGLVRVNFCVPHRQLQNQLYDLAVCRRSRRMPVNVGRPPLVGVLGSGGAFGIGVHFGAARAFAEVGIQLAQAPLVGSSAGAYAAGAFVSALDLDAVLQPWGTTPARRFGHRSIDTVRQIFGDARPATMSGVAARLFGRRVLLPASRYGLVDVVAASSSPPPFAVPHVIEGRHYIDAGLLSICSVDLAPPADLMVVIAPIGGAHMGRMGKLSEFQTRRHIRGWQRARRGRALYITPDRELAATAGSGVDDLFDPKRAPRAEAAAYELTRRRIEQFENECPGALASAAARGSEDG
jgi:predicted acylesterase/phospholipase RssA